MVGKFNSTSDSKSDRSKARVRYCVSNFRVNLLRVNSNGDRKYLMRMEN